MRKRIGELIIDYDVNSNSNTIVSVRHIDMIYTGPEGKHIQSLNVKDTLELIDILLTPIMKLKSNMVIKNELYAYRTSKEIEPGNLDEEVGKSLSDEEFNKLYTMVKNLC